MVENPIERSSATLQIGHSPSRSRERHADREFFGAVLTGKGFSTMSIDLFTVKNGKLASGYHVENWTTALQQINSQ
jgi:hypothetical protein